MKKLTNLGFTLIELLVVISIIALLSSVILASLQDARQKANDTKIIQTIHDIQNSLELFKNENGHYPLSNFRAYYSGGSLFFDDSEFSESERQKLNKFIDIEETILSMPIKNDLLINYVSNAYVVDSDPVVFKCSYVPPSDYPSIAGEDSYVIVLSYPENSHSAFKGMNKVYTIRVGYTEEISDWFAYDETGSITYNSTCFSNP